VSFKSSLCDFSEKIVLIVMGGKSSVLVSILKYTPYFAVYYLIRTPVHEWIHLYVGCLFGGEDYITEIFII